MDLGRHEFLSVLRRKTSPNFEIILFCEDFKTYFKSGLLKQLHLSFTNCFPDLKVFGNFEKRVPAQVNQERKTINNNLILYYMVNPVLGTSLCSDWFFLCQDFAVRSVSMEREASKFQIFNQNSKKKTVNMVILHSETIRKI